MFTTTKEFLVAWQEGGEVLTSVVSWKRLTLGLAELPPSAFLLPPFPL